MVDRYNYKLITQREYDDWNDVVYTRLGKNYGNHHKPMSYLQCRHRQVEHNKKNWASEKKLEKFLRQNAITRYRKNLPVLNRFIGDFVIGSVVLEADGSVHKDVKARRYDNRRDGLLRRCGLRVFRFRMDRPRQWDSLIEQVISVMGTKPRHDKPTRERIKSRRAKKHKQRNAKRSKKKRKEVMERKWKGLKRSPEENKRALDDLKRRRALCKS